MMLWHALSAPLQDAILAIALILPACVIGAVLIRGFAPWPLIGAMLWRFRWINGIFVALIAVAIGMGLALTAQEKGLRTGTARSADKFDLIITAPGSQMQMLMASVFLEPVDAPLLSGEMFDRIANHPNVALAAPLAFGDSYEGHPIVGTTAAFVEYLGEGQITGHMFEETMEAVIGADVPLSVGASFEPSHGIGSFTDVHAHGDTITVVGRMARTGTPWDKAVIVPIETVWDVHGLANGHAPNAHDADHSDHAPIGAPFDPRFFPGTPAVVVKAEGLAATYRLRSEFNLDGETMAFFPGAVLADLYRIIGDVRRGVSTIIAMTQILVAVSVLSALFILSRLFQRTLAVLRALGAPARFVASVVWGYAACLIVCGAGLGIGLGYALAETVAGVIGAQMDMVIPIAIGWSDLHPVLAFASIASVLSLVPALLGLRGSITQHLRA